MTTVSMKASQMSGSCTGQGERSSEGGKALKHAPSGEGILDSGGVGERLFRTRLGVVDFLRHDIDPRLQIQIFRLGVNKFTLQERPRRALRRAHSFPL